MLRIIWCLNIWYPWDWCQQFGGQGIYHIFSSLSSSRRVAWLLWWFHCMKLSEYHSIYKRNNYRQKFTFTHLKIHIVNLCVTFWIIFQWILLFIDWLILFISNVNMFLVKYILYTNYIILNIEQNEYCLYLLVSIQLILYRRGAGEGMFHAKKIFCAHPFCTPSHRFWRKIIFY